MLGPPKNKDKNIIFLKSYSEISLEYYLSGTGRTLGEGTKKFLLYFWILPLQSAFGYLLETRQVTVLSRFSVWPHAARYCWANKQPNYVLLI